MPWGAGHLKGLDLTINSVTWHRSCDIGYRISSKPISMIHENKETRIRNMIEETINVNLYQVDERQKSELTSRLPVCWEPTFID